MQITDKLLTHWQMFRTWMKLVRLPNIIILAAIFILLHFGVYMPIYASLNIVTPMNGWVFGVFVLSVSMIASGGNVINDYFDYQIDLINKPEKLIIEKLIPKQSAMTGYMILTLTGIAGGFVTGWLLGEFKLGFFFGFGALMLYMYSESYKQKLWIGNLIIALLGFLFILLLWIVEFFALRQSAGSFVVVYPSLLKISMLMGGYAIFAFLTTLIREIIKDMEDVTGDKKNGCQTIPIFKGIPAARKIVSGLIVFTIILLFYCGYLCWTHNLKLLSSFLLIAINIPLFILLIRFYKSDTKSEYHAASTLMKWIMVAGILGILLINMHS
jgi:4-hydroxybenzoate polyprenyltransferase